ncbi:MAG TPA: AAA family ATPase [Acetobacteraceae bacterium]|nr:AAA family ATPase [Acetobacteraceae bacterium]
MSGALPFDQIRDAARAQAPRLLRAWFPEGRLVGREFRVGDITGTPGESLRVNLDSGKWSDFANADISGFDLIGLHAKRRRIDRTQAARELGEELGILANGHAYAGAPARADERSTEGGWRPMVPPPHGVQRPATLLARFDRVHEYRAADGNFLFFVGRIEAKQTRRKLFVPLTFGVLDGKRGWHRKSPATPRPLYGLDRLAAQGDAEVIVCEGEKAADAAQALFPERVCLTWPGGARAVPHADFTPLEARRVIIWPDNDRAGRDCAAAIAGRIPQARILRVDDMRPGGDAADILPDDPEQWLREHLPPEATPAAPPFHIVEPAALEGVPVPERLWIVADWLPIGCVTASYGDGGVGKSLLAQMLQVACATGTPWCGLEVMRCASLGLYCEDDEPELHRRQDRINGALGISYAALSLMRWISGVGADNTLVSFDGTGRMLVAGLLSELEREAKSIGARLIVLDTAADLFGGNENDRQQVRRFIGLLNGLALRLEAAVLLNCHPSRQGIATGSLDGASTAWSNSVRSRWSLSRPNGDEEGRPETDERELTRRKANYAGSGETIRLRWINGALVPLTREGGVVGSIMRAACEEVFLALLDRCTSQGVHVMDSRNSGNYAPRIFAARPDRDGYTAKDFEKAMQALFGARRIRVVEYTVKSRPRRRIARDQRPEGDDQ